MTNREDTYSKNPGACFFLGSRSAAGSCDTAAKGFLVPGIAKQNKVHKIHTPKLQERGFSEGAEAPQAAATQPQRARGP